jgi:phage shock protein PspC (stress-responsive transcriptional regulator)
MSNGRLVRSPSEGILGGVCAGMDAYLRGNHAFIRVLFILLISAVGVGTIAYFVLWLLLPADSEEDLAWDQRLGKVAEELAARMRDLGLQISRRFEESHPQLPLYVGGTLVVLGLSFSARIWPFLGLHGYGLICSGRPCRPRPVCLCSFAVPKEIDRTSPIFHM